MEDFREDNFNYESNNDTIKEIGTKLKIIGVGGAGKNILNDLLCDNMQGVSYAVVNTDEQDLSSSNAEEKLSIGHLGAGGKPEVAEKAALSKIREIEDLVEGNDMVFLTGGMGGGTGTGALPVIAKVAKEKGILTVALTTKPFSFEGLKRERNAESGIANLKKYADILITIPNQKLLDLPEFTTFGYKKLLQKSNDILRFAIKGISELIRSKGFINLDFADIQTVIENSGDAIFGYAEAHKDNEEEIDSLIENLISNPLLDRTIEGATKILVNIKGDPETVSFFLINKIVTQISELANTKTGRVEDLFHGVVETPDSDKIIVSLIATDFDDTEEKTITNEFYNKEYNKETVNEDIVPEF